MRNKKSITTLISCVVPVHNEQSNIVPFLTALEKQLKLLKTDFEIIVVNDGSTDQTEKKVVTYIENHTTTKLISFSRNFGKENALTAGAKRSSGDAVIFIDADFQHPLEKIPEFFQYWKDGDEMIYGVQQNRPTKSLLKNYLPRFFYFLINKCSKIHLDPNASDFRLLDRKVVEAINQLPEHNRFMKGLFSWVGFKTKAVPFKVAERQKGRSSYHLKQLAELAITGFTSFSDAPLRILSILGLFISFIALLFAFYIIIKTLVLGVDVPGYATITVLIIFFGGIQLFSIGILGEYIARIFHEVKQRPHYLINKEYGFD